VQSLDLTVVCMGYIVTRHDTLDLRYLLSGGRAPGSGHDVSSPDVNLDLPDAHFGCTTGFGGCNMAMDRRPTKKQAPAGELAGFTALGAHEARQSHWEYLRRPGPPGRNTDSTCHDRHGREQAHGEGPRHCIVCQHLQYYGLHALPLHV
jgi:hypothetical protein